SARGHEVGRDRPTVPDPRLILDAPSRGRRRRGVDPPTVRCLLPAASSGFGATRFRVPAPGGVACTARASWATMLRSPAGKGHPMKPEIASALKLLDVEPHNPDALAALTAAADGGGNGKSDPAAARALAEARRLHRDRGDLELVAKLFELELGWEKDPGRRAALLFEQGRLLLDELFDERGAEAAFTRAAQEEKIAHAEARA